MGTMARKKSAKKELILKTAAAMFREKGFAASSMRDLAEKIGIEAASLYNHIQSKAQILEEIIDGVSDECQLHLDNLEKSKSTALEKIESLIRFHTKMMMNRFEEYSVMVSQWMHLDGDKLLRFATNRRDYVRRMEAIVESGIQKGELKSLMPYVVVLNILSSVRGLEFWQRSAKTHTAQEMEDNMVVHLIGGIKR
ncbi:TetR/AcrR family transcriptional regulator [Niabella ginsengisoli]|uniref:TetR/AcrR family transcriptional regulator n=1 Tax=Niabella ginsengisoli TaxID=522298 RepID=A0ABS9SN96_9BACT|nr:TetR/AcrR family transcriptional regulator [Niabella ginsengisoli]MCH5599873.1 TetR/AcrR family transcriptional regulator [Niabella ginsengisoli]